MKTALDKFGGAHVLVANAGIVRHSPIEKLSEKDWDEIMAIHLRSIYKVWCGSTNDADIQLNPMN